MLYSVMNFQTILMPKVILEKNVKKKLVPWIHSYQKYALTMHNNQLKSMHAKINMGERSVPELTWHPVLYMIMEWHLDISIILWPSVALTFNQSKKFAKHLLWSNINNYLSWSNHIRSRLALLLHASCLLIHAVPIGCLLHCRRSETK